VADELTASLYGDLFVTSKSSNRGSKLLSYSGLGSLAGWLRAVLAQNFVNRLRRNRREVSLDEHASWIEARISRPACEVAQADHRVGHAVQLALQTLAAEDRYILAAYYLDRRTLLEIARTLGVHESTVSRRLDRTLRALRARVAELLTASGMDARQIAEALEMDVRDLAVDVRSALIQGNSGAPLRASESSSSSQ
jgi:RNA polymerase sigma-70 factor (ECF subfamily)